MNINQLALSRLEGYEAKEWIYISTVGRVASLGDVEYLDHCNNYSTVRGCSIMILCTNRSPAIAYDIAAKVIEAKALNVCIWVLENPQIAELVYYGKELNPASSMPMSPSFKKLVGEMSEAMR